MYKLEKLSINNALTADKLQYSVYSLNANSHCTDRCRPTVTVTILQYVTSQTFQDHLQHV